MDAVTVEWKPLTNTYLPHPLQITGTVSSHIGKMIQLQSLYIGATGLSGTLPTEIGLLSELQWLSSSSSKLGGKLPNEMFLNLSMLLDLDLSACQFSGTISPSIALLSNLEWLRLDNNRFSGSLPNVFQSDFWVRVTLNGNNFDAGPVPDSICNRGEATSFETKIVADCTPDPTTGVAHMECPARCCTTCCSPETGICTPR